VNLYLQALARSMRGTDEASYAWMITKDHLDDEPGGSFSVSGPSDAPDDLLAALAKGRGHTFRLYDDDGELYYTGRGTWRGDAAGEAPDEDACYGPLGDYGAASGCVLVRWHGHSEWDCG
jgi:hypothetical protein